MDFIIITGLSGAGKSKAIDALEDLGFYCVDNLPPKLLVKFAELCSQSEGKLSKVAFVTDTRGGELFHGLFEALDEMQSSGFTYKLLFLDCDDTVIMHRFKETRRKHPLLDTMDGSIEKAISGERLLLKPAMERADYVINTTYLSPAQLKEQISKLFGGTSVNGLIINSMSFGFKYGVPTEADLVFDVRCLPNPFYVEELKYQTGLDIPVSSYVMSFDSAKAYLQKVIELIDFSLPLYQEEGKSQLVIAFGCTGGKHRSVTFAEAMGKHLLDQGYQTNVFHRDITK